MSSKKRSHKTEKLARIYDDEILPVWGQKFGRLLLRDLELPDKGQILEVACGTGYVTTELLTRLGESTRLIAIDGASVMLDVARRKVEKMGSKGVFFRTASAEPRLSFADDVYDMVVCNLGLPEMDEPPRSLADFARVTFPGGAVRCTLPLAGTFVEFYDIYREVLIKHDKHEALERLDEHLIKSYPTVDECERWMRGARLGDARVEVESFTLLFKSSREFFFAPVIEYGPLATWKAIAGQGQEMQDAFWYIKEAIDAYFGDRAFELTVVAGCLIGNKREITEEESTSEVERIDPPEPAPYSRADDNPTSTTMLVEDALIESERAIGPFDRHVRGEATAELDLEEMVEIIPEDDLEDELDEFVNPGDSQSLDSDLPVVYDDD
jgi:ubiquinone/menaquinone biosynthesis C-methylase UbiE